MIGVGYRSTDGGDTFVALDADARSRTCSASQSAAASLYLAGKNYSDGWALATSHDEGVTVTPLSSYDRGRAASSRAR